MDDLNHGRNSCDMLLERAQGALVAQEQEQREREQQALEEEARALAETNARREAEEAQRREEERARSRRRCQSTHPFRECSDDGIAQGQCQRCKEWFCHNHMEKRNWFTNQFPGGHDCSE